MTTMSGLGGSSRLFVRNTIFFISPRISTRADTLRGTARRRSPRTSPPSPCSLGAPARRRGLAWHGGLGRQATRYVHPPIFQ